MTGAAHRPRRARGAALVLGTAALAAASLLVPATATTATTAVPASAGVSASAGVPGVPASPAAALLSVTDPAGLAAAADAVRAGGGTVLACVARPTAPCTVEAPT